MSQMDTTSPKSASTADTPVMQELKSHACVLCQRRKVKCDRRDPCGACTKARAQCEFRAPAPPRRRPRRSAEGMLVARIRRYEELLKGYGVQIEPLSSSAETTREVDNMDIVPKDTNSKPKRSPGQVLNTSMPSKEQITENGRIVMKNGKARYLENKLWTHLSDEFMEAGDILPVSSDDEDAEASPSYRLQRVDLHGSDLLLGSPANIDLRNLHPLPIQGLRLWQTFLDNVNPLVKIIHAPTLQQAMLEATEDLGDVPKAMESLMFAIYACAIVSMGNAECEKILGEARADVLARYQSAARQALIGAGLLKSSNIMVLQAFVLFLHSLRQGYIDSQSLWILTGVATRIAVRLGLHRDGADLGLPPFEAEMRRRLWWQIALLESRAGEFSGVGQLLMHMNFTTRMPLNINDGSLHQSMVDLPVEENGATEMIHCLLRYEIGNFMKQGNATSAFDGTRQKFTSSEVSVDYKEKAIRELEELLEGRYLRYCDPSIPLHYVSAIMARLIMCKMRFRTLHPRHHWARNNVPQEEREILFSVCIKIIEYDNIIQASSSSQNFLWHIRAQFQWDALIHVLSELRSREAGEQTHHAWRQVDEVFKYHSFTDTKKGLHVAIVRLTARAWESYEKTCGRNQQVAYQVDSKQMLEILRARDTILGTAAEGAKVESRVKEKDGSDPVAAENMVDGVVPAPEFDFSTWPLESSTMDWQDWSRWDDLLQDSELNPISTSF